MHIAIITVSDRAYSGDYTDETGPRLVAEIQSLGSAAVVSSIVPDERSVISNTIIQCCNDTQFDVVITNGGTGLSPRDVTPEATGDVIDREIPGLAEAMRAVGRTTTPFADLARQRVGHRGPVLIANVPGSPKGAIECLRAIFPALGHAVEILKAN